jgi:hypothetical protein
MKRSALPVYAAAIAGICAAGVPAFAEEPGEARTSSTAESTATYDEAVEEGPIESEEPPEDTRDDGPKYRNPQGSLMIQGYGGASFSDQGTRIGLGLGIGYAVVTGVVPGIHGELSTGTEGLGGELSANLTLTPPLSLSLTPFARGEVGHHWVPSFGDGWAYGAGGGIFIGDPASSVAFQLGWMFRRLTIDGVNYDISGPIIAFSIRVGG